MFKCIFFNENVWFPIKISLKFVPKGPINNIPALVQIMAWRRPGDKPLSEPMMVILSTHICVTWPQWVKGYGPSVSTRCFLLTSHYSDAIMGMIASQITSLTIVYSTLYSGADKTKHQNSASLAFVWGIHHWPVNSLHKWLVTWKMLPFDDVIMIQNGQWDLSLAALTSVNSL